MPEPGLTRLMCDELTHFMARREERKEGVRHVRGPAKPTPAASRGERRGGMAELLRLAVGPPVRQCHDFHLGGCLGGEMLPMS